LALRILTGSPKSSAALKEALMAKGIEEDVAEDVIARYREVGLLDDAALAAAIARARHRDRARSKRAIGVELRRKGFGKDDVTAALGEISDEEELKTAREFAERRWEATRGMSDETRSRRVAGALGRRGYPPGMAIALVSDLKRADIWDNPQGEAARFEEE